MRQTLTYGILPTEDEFRAVFNAQVQYGTRIRCERDEVFGNALVDCPTLWRALNEQVKIGSERSLDWCSWILGSFGIEWI